MKHRSRHESATTRRSHRRSPIPKRGRTWPEEIDGLLEQTLNPDPQERRKAVHALCPCNVQTENGLVWDRLIALASDPDVRVRADVLHTLCDGSPRSREAEIVGALERMQHDPDRKLRRRVRQLLAHYRAGGKLNIL